MRRYVGHLVELDVPVESVRGRYGGYRLGPSYRMPPLMLTDDEALAVLLGLAAARRAGLVTGAGTASETAAAKIRRVLPRQLAARMESVLDSVTVTSSARQPAAAVPMAPGTDVLLAVADAVRNRRPLSIRYTAGGGRRSERTFHGYGLVAHAGRWYLTGGDPAIGEDRTFRLDRITDARVLPGSFEPPAGVDPAQRVLSALATAPYRHHVILHIQGTAAQIRTVLPASIAVMTPAPDLPPAPDATVAPDTPPDSGELSGLEGEADQRADGWRRVELRAERLDWLPPLLASLDLPFSIEQPAELRGAVAALARRLAASACRNSGQPG